MISPLIRKHAADLLNLAADEFSNHGCNDYELKNTPENRAFAAAIHGEEHPIDENDPTIWVQDDVLMRYCAQQLRSNNDWQPSPEKSADWEQEYSITITGKTLEAMQFLATFVLNSDRPSLAAIAAADHLFIQAQTIRQFR